MIRDDLDRLDGIPPPPNDPWTQPVLQLHWRMLVVIVLLYMLLIGLSCAMIFRWTNVPPEDQPYSAPIRTRPPQPRNGPACPDAFSPFHRYFPGCR